MDTKPARELGALDDIEALPRLKPGFDEPMCQDMQCMVKENGLIIRVV
jgi:hypothetical protein